MSNDLLNLLMQRLHSTISDGASLVLLFAEWFNIDVETPTEEELSSLWRYQLVADAAMRGVLGKSINYQFSDGLTFLKQKEYFVPNKIPGFEADPLAILAVAIGIEKSGLDTNDVDWLNTIITCAIDKEQDKWRLDLLKAARVILKIDVQSLNNVIIRCALSSKGLCQIEKDDHKLVEEQCLTFADASSEDALFRYVALNTLIKVAGRIRFGKTQIEDISELLKNVEPALKRWPFEEKAKTKNSTIQKWDIQNEYHVQSYLWALLRPIFSDLQDEEYLKSVGYKHPRVDLAIESLKLIIEVKYLRESNQSALADLVEQIAADASLYLSLNNESFDKIIVFVWDNTGSVQHHNTLIQGMKQIRGIVEAVVVSRPGNWK